jgi:precorrin-6B methylase 1
MPGDMNENRVVAPSPSRDSPQDLAKLISQIAANLKNDIEMCSRAVAELEEAKRSHDRAMTAWKDLMQSQLKMYDTLFKAVVTRLESTQDP